MKFLRRLFSILLFLAIGIFLFLSFADSQTKASIFEELGIQRGSTLREISLESYVSGSKVVANKNLLGKWVIRGWLKNTHMSRTVQEVRIRINFSRSSESVTINKLLNPRGLGKPFTVKLAGHQNENFINWKIIRAK